jgi:hypothetical protein
MAFGNWQASTVLENRYLVLIPIPLTLVVTALCVWLIPITLHLSDPLFRLGTIGGVIAFLVMFAEFWVSVCLFLATGPALMHAWVTGDYFGTLFDLMHFTAFFVQSILLAIPIVFGVMIALVCQLYCRSNTSIRWC